MSEKKLFLLDGMALIYRAFFAFSQNPRITSTGLNASAMFGFTNTLLDILNNQKPSHLAVVFDTSAPTARHEEYKEYKAHREEMPEDLAASLPWVFRIIEGFGVPIITKDGFEADDIIGTLAWQAADQGFTVYMMTPDKDFGQLVRDGVFIFKPARMGNDFEIMGPAEVCKRWDIERVDQVIEMLGLMGDKVDNIPGIPGVGEKTAQKLLAQYGTIEGIYENIDKLQGKLKEKFEQHRGLAFLSRRLATIDTQVPVKLEEFDITVDPVKPELKQVFEELEFRTFIKRLFPEAGTAPAPQAVQASLFGDIAAPHANSSSEKPVEKEVVLHDIQTVTHNYRLCDTEAEISALAKAMQEAKAFCFDTETTGLDALVADIVGLAVSIRPHEGWYVPFGSDQEKNREVLQQFKAALEGPALKIGQNIKYDLLILRRYGIEVRGPLFDTMLAHYLVEPDKRHNMDILAEHYLHYRPVSIETLIGRKGKNQLSMAEIPVDKVKEYAVEDADITLQLKEKLAPELRQREVEKVFRDVEIPLIHVLADIEMEGVKVDVDFLHDYSRQLAGDSDRIEQEIYTLAGQKFNIGSPRQVGEILFDKLQLSDNAKTTKTGQYQTDEETLLGLASAHPVVQRILDYRQLQKLKSTYVDALPTMVNPHTGRVHTSFNQAVAATGRLSSNNPNLQNIPIRTDLGKEVRKAFVPRDANHVLLSCDYSQIELRVIASISGDEAMMEAFNRNVDIHTATAARVFGVPLESVDKEMRRRAKTVNFGIIYGISAFGLSQRIGIPRKEAKDIIDSYFREFPGIRDYMDQTLDFARRNEFVETLLGRRRYIRDINSRNMTVRGFAERNAINAPIQGSAADMIKIAMIHIHQLLDPKQYQTRMILQVHDELLFDVPKEELSTVEPMLRKAMEEALPLRVPVLVESGQGNNWLEAH
jgi:DNA polymerase-1